jgi:hypothetical protein
MKFKEKHFFYIGENTIVPHTVQKPRLVPGNNNVHIVRKFPYIVGNIQLLVDAEQFSQMTTTLLTSINVSFYIHRRLQLRFPFLVFKFGNVTGVSYFKILQYREF